MLQMLRASFNKCVVDPSNLIDCSKGTANPVYSDKYLTISNRVCRKERPLVGGDAMLYRSSTCCLDLQASSCVNLRGLAPGLWSPSFLKIAKKGGILDEKEQKIQSELRGGLAPWVYSNFAQTQFNTPGFFMETVSGQSFQDFTKTTLWKEYIAQPLDANPAISIFNCAVLKSIQAIDSLAQKGVLHNDFHDGNIFLSETGSDGCGEIRVIDFGRSAKVEGKPGVLDEKNLGLLFSYLELDYQSALVVTNPNLSPEVRAADKNFGGLPGVSDATGVVVKLKPSEKIKQALNGLVGKYGVLFHQKAAIAHKFGVWRNELDSRLVARAGKSHSVGKCTTAPVETAAGRKSIWKYLIDKSGIWADFLKEPSDSAAKNLQKTANCLMRKAVLAISRDGKILTNLEGFYVENSEKTDCPDVAVATTPESKLCPVTVADQLAVALIDLLSTMNLLYELIRELTVNPSTKLDTDYSLEELRGALRKVRVVPVELRPDEAFIALVRRLVDASTVSSEFVKQNVVDPEGWTALFYQTLLDSKPLKTFTPSRRHSEVLAQVVQPEKSGSGSERERTERFQGICRDWAGKPVIMYSEQYEYVYTGTLTGLSAAETECELTETEGVPQKQRLGWSTTHHFQVGKIAEILQVEEKSRLKFRPKPVEEEVSVEEKKIPEKIASPKQADNTTTITLAFCGALGLVGVYLILT